MREKAFSTGRAVTFTISSSSISTHKSLGGQFFFISYWFFCLEDSGSLGHETTNSTLPSCQGLMQLPSTSPGGCMNDSPSVGGRQKKEKGKRVHSYRVTKGPTVRAARLVWRTNARHAPPPPQVWILTPVLTVSLTTSSGTRKVRET